jgi:hypothetical protein
MIPTPTTFSEQLSSRESRKVSRCCRARACVGKQPLTPLDRRRRIFIPNINWQIAVASAVTAGATGVGRALGQEW